MVKFYLSLIAFVLLINEGVSVDNSDEYTINKAPLSNIVITSKNIHLAPIALDRFKAYFFEINQKFANDLKANKLNRDCVSKLINLHGTNYYLPYAMKNISDIAFRNLILPENQKNTLKLISEECKKVTVAKYVDILSNIQTQLTQDARNDAIKRILKKEKISEGDLLEDIDYLDYRLITHNIQLQAHAIFGLNKSLKDLCNIIQSSNTINACK